MPACQITIPRTLLRRWGTGAEASPALWAKLAPWLDRVWDEATTLGIPPTTQGVLQAALEAGLPRSLDHDAFVMCADVALDAGTLSLRQARTAARQALRTHSIPTVGLLPPEYIRDGHTSSVFRAGAWAVNVARDREDATRELLATASALRQWQGAPEVRVPEIHGVQTISTPWFNTRLDVAILIVGWLDRAKELHLVGTPVGPRFVRVAHFVPKSEGNLCLVGSPLGARQTAAVWSAVAVAQIANADIDLSTGTLATPNVDYNDGDVVLCHDGTPGLVGASGTTFVAPLPVWPYAMSLVAAPDDLAAGNETLQWNDPPAAVAATYRGLQKRGMTTRQIHSVFEAAGKLNLAQIQEFLPHSCKSAIIESFERTRRACSLATPSSQPSVSLQTCEIDQDDI